MESYLDINSAQAARNVGLANWAGQIQARMLMLGQAPVFEPITNSNQYYVCPLQILVSIPKIGPAPFLLSLYHYDYFNVELKQSVEQTADLIVGAIKQNNTP